ncbi:MAG: D-aminoacylase [Gemmatimonadaceae bacterium]
MRTRSFATLAAVPLLLGTRAPLPAQAPTVVDVLIRNGQVVDGSGAAPRRADVGIRGDRIAFIGNASRARVTGTRTIDAAGLVVAPGFIDPHTHTLEDLNSPQRRQNVNYLMQGVTTVITGNDGGGPADIAATLDGWERGGIGTNAALLVGQGTVRRSVLGMSDAKPTPAQLDSMRALVLRAMRGGALGMSTGLYYAPGSYATTDEVIALARVAAEQGGVYDSHLRDESSYTIGLVGAVTEAIRIAREARIPVNISHIKALGADVWGQSDSIIALIKRARSEGLQVTADQYPYKASGSSVGASLLPRWAEVGGRDSLAARIADSSVRRRLVAEMTANLRRRGGAASLLITGGRDSSVRGKTLAAVATARGIPPIDAALEIIRGGDASVASFNMDERDIENFMRQSFVTTGSDGSGGHPRKYGTFPRKLKEYVYRRKIVTLPFAIRASSALTAEHFRIPERGTLREGYYADVIAYDPVTLSDRATYEQPELLATGMRYVFVNGVPAIDGGKYTGATAGRPLRNRSAQRAPAQAPVPELR